jgi:zinc protease
VLFRSKASQVIGFDLQLNEPGAAVFGAILGKQDSIEDARKIVLDTLDGIIKEPPSKDEVERAKTRLLKDIELQLRDSERIGMFMSEWASMGDWRLLFLSRDRLRKVTPEDVQRVAKAYLKSSNRTVAEFIPDPKPDRATIPAKTDFQAALKDYKGDAAMSQGEAFDPSPANIESRLKRSTLPSGMKLSLLSKKTRGNTVSASLRLHYGTLETVTGRNTAASLAISTLIRGTDKHNRQQIQDELDRLKADVRITGNATSVSVDIQTVRENLPAAMQLVAEILEHPSFPETEFEQIRKQRLTSAESGKSDPQVIVPTELNRVMHPHPKGDVRATLTPDEQMDELRKATLDEAKKFYKDFVGASNAEFAVVGDFDPVEVGKLASDLFGSWKSPAPYQRVTDPYRNLDVVNRSIETPDKENAWFMAGIRLNIMNNDPDYPALVLGNYILGGGFLNSRLAVRIRQKEGLSYGVGSTVNASSLDNDGSFRVYAIAAPQNVAKVEAACKEEIEKAIKDGFTAEEIAAAKSGWLQSRQVDRADDDALSRTLATRDFEQRNMTWDADLEKKVGALTAQQIQEAFKRYLDLTQLTIIKGGDFKKASAAN